MERQSYVALVPVKSPAVGKSRLRVPDPVRRSLATAFALDVLHAVRASAAVVEAVVVTADQDFAQRAAGLGLRTVPDSGDLNASLAAAADAVRQQWPAAVPLAVCADLPCLDPDDLTRALEGIPADRPWFVPDADGTGTTMYAAPYDDFRPRFGPNSRNAHEAAGATPLEGDSPTLRRDVDDEASLVEAERLGVGPHTRAALGALLP